MKKSLIGIVLLASVILVSGACFFNMSWVKPVRLETSGSLQKGEEYKVVCDMAPLSPYSLKPPIYQIESLQLHLAGRIRSVPSVALGGISEADPKKPPQLTEEGPVIVITTWAGEHTGSHSVQWRFLNGQFAQRRVLKNGEVTVKNADARLVAPSIVENTSPDAPRRLQSGSLLSAPADAAPQSLLPAKP